ncbi:hypothetical protein Clacol_003795 [Clathrus columnatus]|uniref:SH3 domain-containing protein n=1 Tax=Clathrus columnatus TaxID=1419009 RepID=A0AAV5A4Q4_9AGAM|nr:hypothetical protein Clacol_003795 [Clathrus columnatus]
MYALTAGSGVVVAKLPDGRWTAPSAIGTAGMGLGGQAGAEVTDFLIVLNSQAKSFMSAGSLTLGGNVSIALGPLGRNSEAASSVNTDGRVAMMYSYSQTRGLFGGVSIEGSVIVERQDANASAYGPSVTCKMLLNGAIRAPSWADELHRTLEACTGLPGGRTWIADSPNGIEAQKYVFGSAAVRSPELSPKRKRSSGFFPPTAWGKRKDSGSFFETENDKDSSSGMTNHRYSVFDKNKDDHLWSAPIQEGPNVRSGESLSDVVIAKAVAQYDFQALQPGDLGFKKGDTISVIIKSDKVDDW